MKLLVIGGTGFIGRHVVRRLVEMRHRVAILHRGVTGGAFPESVEHVIADQKDLERGVAADVVVDMILASERQVRRRVSAFAGVAGRLLPSAAWTSTAPAASCTARSPASRTTGR